MSNRNRKAKATTFADKKLAKVEKKNAELQQQLQATNMSLMNMRQMYEGAVTEKQGLRAQLARTTQILTGLIIQAKKQKLVLKADTFPKLQEFAGFEPVADEDGNLILTPISADMMEEMEEDLEGDEDE